MHHEKDSTFPYQGAEKQNRRNKPAKGVAKSGNLEPSLAWEVADKGQVQESVKNK